MPQIIRKAFDLLARLLLEALDSDELHDQHVIGLADRLSGHIIRRSRKTPIRHRVQRPADDVAIPAISLSKSSASSGEGPPREAPPNPDL